MKQSLKETTHIKKAINQGLEKKMKAADIP